MTKTEFILQLHERLYDLPQNEVEDRLTFYTEMIEERMEEGYCEEDAVAAIGSVDEIAGQIIADISLPTKLKPKRKRKVWESVLLILGSPVWLSLLLAAFAVVLSLYISLWAVIISLWAVFASLAGCALGCVVGGIVFTLGGYIPSGIATVSVGLVCAGLSIFAFYGCKAVTVGSARLTKLPFQKYFSKRRKCNG